MADNLLRIIIQAIDQASGVFKTVSKNAESFHEALSKAGGDNNEILKVLQGNTVSFEETSAITLKQFLAQWQRLLLGLRLLILG